MTRASKSELTQDYLKEILHYDSETGVFRWRVQMSSRALAGDVAGSEQHYGYRQLCINYRVYLAHRLAWLYVYGEWPVQIDHINGVRDDNRIENLREAKSQSEQLQNLSPYKNNTSGHSGVHWFKRDGKWQAQISAGGKRRHLGLFDTPEEAAIAYREAKENYHEFNPVARESAT